MTPKQQWHQANVLSLTASRKMNIFWILFTARSSLHLHSQEMLGRAKVNENSTTSGLFALAF